jgi:hypothetical protein
MAITCGYATRFMETIAIPVTDGKGSLRGVYRLR